MAATNPGKSSGVSRLGRLDPKAWLRWLGISWRGLRELAGFISALTVIAAAVVWLTQQWRHHQDWRPVENAHVASLRSTRLLAAVHETFGVPVARRVGPQHVAAEYFHRHDYWLQILYDSRADGVLGWTLTACNDDFRPSFSYAGATGPIQLWRSTIADVGGLVLFASVRFWRAHTIHQPNQLIEFGRLPGVLNFVGVVGGLADICSSEFRLAADLIAKTAPEAFQYDGLLERCSPCAGIAQRTRINTYGEIYDGRDLSWFYKKIGLVTPTVVAAGPFFTAR